MNTSETMNLYTIDIIKNYIGNKSTFINLGISLSDNDKQLSMHSPNPDYIEPYLIDAEIGVGVSLTQKPNVLLVSAPASTGKSQLCDYLSSSMGIPVLNLSNCEQLGTYSLTGILTGTLNPGGYAKFIDALKSGEQSLIIDAVDEGMLKSGMSGFEAFIDDMISRFLFEDKLSIIMLGRSQSIENVALYLAQHNVIFSVLQISSFSEEQANKFIDKKVNPSIKYTIPYKELKNYIINSIGSFFKDKREAKESFLGYAPVLDAICTAIKGQSDYNAFLSELKGNSTTGIDLVIQIIKSIMAREKDDKVNKQGIDSLKNSLSKQEYINAITDIYTELEQCRALLNKIYGDKYEVSFSKNPVVNSTFNANLNGFIADHPFLEGVKFKNIVFESYVLAILIKNDPENIYLYNYLNDKYRDNYMLVFIYTKLFNKSEINIDFLPYLYRAIVSFDSSTERAFTSINNIEEYKHIVTFKRNLEGKPFSAEFSAYVTKPILIDLGRIISNLELISEWIDVSIVRNTTEFLSPVFIQVKNITIGGELYIGNSSDNCENEDDVQVLLDADNIVVDYSYSSPKININDSTVSFVIVSETQLHRPFSDYQLVPDYNNVDFTNEEKEVYVKFRKILISFRSHSKGTIARYKGKIDDSRISGKEYGRKIVEALISQGVIDEDTTFYYLNRNRCAEVLGLTFDKLKTLSVTSEIKVFIREILDN